MFEPLCHTSAILVKLALYSKRAPGLALSLIGSPLCGTQVSGIGSRRRLLHKHAQTFCCADHKHYCCCPAEVCSITVSSRCPQQLASAFNCCRRPAALSAWDITMRGQQIATMAPYSHDYRCQTASNHPPLPCSIKLENASQSLHCCNVNCNILCLNTLTCDIAAETHFNKSLEQGRLRPEVYWYDILDFH